MLCRKKMLPIMLAGLCSMPSHSMDFKAFTDIAVVTGVFCFGLFIGSYIQKLSTKNYSNQDLANQPKNHVTGYYIQTSANEKLIVDTRNKKVYSVTDNQNQFGITLKKDSTVLIHQSGTKKSINLDTATGLYREE